MRRFPMLTGLVALAALLGLACGGDDSTGPTPPTVALIVVTSPIDTLIASDWTAQLAAVARDAHGNTIAGIQFTWSTSNPAVATVGAGGLVHAMAPGFASITAEARGVHGSLRLRVLDADLSGISAVLNDPYTVSLVSHLQEPAHGNVQSALNTCADGVSTGNIVAIVQGLASAEAEASTATHPDDVALLAVLALMLDHSERLLNL